MIDINKISQKHAENIILRHQYLYYVLGISELSDTEYDQLEKSILDKYPNSFLHHCVGSAHKDDYPNYIVLQRIPKIKEQEEWDKVIEERVKNRIDNKPE